MSNEKLNLNNLFWKVSDQDYWNFLKLKLEDCHFEFQYHNLLSPGSIFITDNFNYNYFLQSKDQNVFFVLLLKNIKEIENSKFPLSLFDYFFINEKEEDENTKSDQYNNLIKKYETFNRNINFKNKVQFTMNSELDFIQKIELQNNALSELENKIDETLKVQNQLIKTILLISNEIDINKILIYLEKELLHFNINTNPEVSLLVNTNSSYYTLYTKQGGYYVGNATNIPENFFIHSHLVNSPTFLNEEWLTYLNIIAENKYINYKSVTTFPLHNYFKSKKNSVKVILIINHKYSSEQNPILLKYLSTRVPYFSIAIESCLIHDEIYKSSTLWFKTFENLTDPIGIITEDKKVINQNPAFEKINTKHDNILVKSLNTNEDQVLINDEIYLKSNYLTTTNDNKKNYLLYLKNITQSKKLQFHIHINSKLSVLKNFISPLIEEVRIPLDEIFSLISEKNTLELSSDIEELKKAAERAISILSALSNFAKGNAEFEFFNLNELILQCEIFFKTLKRKNKISYQLSEVSGKIKVSAPLFQHVIFNLVKNASEVLNKDGQIKISTILQINNSKAGVLISIEDNGPGVPESIRTQLFKTPITTKDLKQGTGIGLLFCSKIIQSFNGTLDYERNNPLGSKFSIWLPIIL